MPTPTAGRVFPPTLPKIMIYPLFGPAVPLESPLSVSTAVTFNRELTSILRNRAKKGKQLFPGDKMPIYGVTARGIKFSSWDGPTMGSTA
mmetsp:Transcript_64532/g.75703  ORF Transcript_64532/g.75703 Transcript_64532/m.75703 type:complete len:90 (+) Transcript_64532:378-647(+)